eukprot:scaffold3273_cov148-Cylindrotheca_fusiformis.AAC.14
MFGKKPNNAHIVLEQWQAEPNQAGGHHDAYIRSTTSSRVVPKLSFQSVADEAVRVESAKIGSLETKIKPMKASEYAQQKKPNLHPNT